MAGQLHPSANLPPVEPQSTHWTFSLYSIHNTTQCFIYCWWL